MRANEPKESGQPGKPNAGRSSDDAKERSALEARRGALISEGRLPERPQMAGRPPGTGRPGAGCGRNGPGVSMLAEAASWPPGTRSHSLHPLTSGFFYLEREWEWKTHAGWVWIDTTVLQSSASGSCDRTGTRARTAAGLGRLRAEGRSVLVSGRRRVPTGLSLHRGRGRGRRAAPSVGGRAVGP